LTVNFDGSGSSDPDPGDTLSYQWTFGDGSPVQETSTSTTSHVYQQSGQYTASLTVQDQHGASSAPATTVISSGNSPPSTVITTTPGKVFRVGQSLTFRGKATDPEEGAEPAQRLSWTVILHHADHTHPFLGPVTGTSITLTGPAPEDLAAATSSYLEIRLTGTDSTGLSSTAVYTLNPKKINVTLASNPAGLTLQVNGTSVTGPTTFVSWASWSIEIFAPSPQGAHTFIQWSNGGAQRQVVAPARNKTFTAKFT
jgi:PKD repeat protein